MTRFYWPQATIFTLQKSEWGIILFGLVYALYWLMVSPIQYTGDSEGYLGVARMLLGKSPHGMAPIFRSPGYPILLILTGSVIPGTFNVLLCTQAVMAAIIPWIVYRILIPYSPYIALITAITVVLTGTTTVHISQIMTESLFTLLLFIGLSIAIKLARTTYIKPMLFYWLAIVFAALNSVRPIAWFIFWVFLLLFTWILWHKNSLIHLWKSIMGSAILFMSLMCAWGIADDVFLSSGAQYSPQALLRVPDDNNLEVYLYDLPFIEAYFTPWVRRIELVFQSPIELNVLQDKPGMAKIRNIVLEQLIKDKKKFSQNIIIYPFHLFAKYADKPQELADRMFALPNYDYANYIHAAIKHSLSKEQRLALYNAVAKESGRSWPRRWLSMWFNNPLLPLMGPSHGNGPQNFLLAYTSLIHYLSEPPTYSSLINNNNGPATKLMLTSLTESLRNHPETWRGTNSIFSPYLERPDALIEILSQIPNQQYAWDIASLLWNTLGYNTMSNLLNQVANETFIAHKIPLILRIWDTILMVAAGPGYIDLNHLGPKLGQVEIYDYLETPQLAKRQKSELRSTQQRYQITYRNWQLPVAWGYFLFYLCKPLFLLTSIISLAILWTRKHAMIVPIILMLPYITSVAIYGIFFTALPRYTDPTLILPFIVTMLAIPDCYRIYNERRSI